MSTNKITVFIIKWDNINSEANLKCHDNTVNVLAVAKWVGGTLQVRKHLGNIWDRLADHGINEVVVELKKMMSYNFVTAPTRTKTI